MQYVLSGILSLSLSLYIYIYIYILDTNVDNPTECKYEQAKYL